MKRAIGLAPTLRDKGHEVAIVIAGESDNRDATAHLGGVMLKEFAGVDGRSAVRAQKESLVAGGSYDVVHICGLGWRNALRPKRCNCGVAVMDHVEIESTLLATSPFRRWLQARLEAWSLETYDAHVGASRYLVAWLRRHLFRKRLRKPLLWLSYANDYSEAKAPGALVSEIRERYAPRKLVVYFGNFYREYGFWQLLRSAQALQQRRDDFTLVLAGRGPEQAAGEAFVREHGLAKHVVFAGYLTGSNALGHLQAAQACVVPLADTETDWARSPGKLYNCMNSGRPVVTAPVGEARDCFTSPEFFYEPTAPEGMTAAVARALDAGADWRPNYRVDLHSWDKRAEKWLNWVESIPRAQRH